MIYGLLIGIGIILPGVSGGVIAVILGVYDKIIFAFNNLKNDKSNLKYLIRITIGVIIGVFISAKLLKHFFNIYNVEMSYLFIGLILGTIPLLIKSYNEKCKDKLNYILLVITFIISFIISLFVKNSIDINSNNIILLLLSGVLFAIGKVIPGVSSSVLLNMIGKYYLFLEIFSSPLDYLLNNTISLIIILFGFIIGLYFSIKLVSFLLKRYYSITYSIIIGFVLGSVSSLYPSIINFPGIMFMLIGLVISLGIPLIKK